MNRRRRNSQSMSRVLVLLAVVPLGCAPSATQGDVVAEVFGNAANFALLRSADKVQACRLEPIDTTKPTHRPDDYEEGPFVDVSEAQAARYRDVLENPRSYYFDVAKKCVPVYGVRVRFGSNAEAIDVNLCFECNILTVSRDGNPVGGEDFDPARRELVALCKELFPDDSEIQKLDPRRP
jgi:hypothetical protein